MTLDDIINIAGPLVGANPFAGLGPTDFDKEYEIERTFLDKIASTAASTKKGEPGRGFLIDMLADSAMREVESAPKVNPDFGSW